MARSRGDLHECADELLSVLTWAVCSLKDTRNEVDVRVAIELHVSLPFVTGHRWLNEPGRCNERNINFIVGATETNHIVRVCST